LASRKERIYYLSVFLLNKIFTHGGGPVVVFDAAAVVSFK
jgi:hypothetical protein